MPTDAPTTALARAREIEAGMTPADWAVLEHGFGHGHYLICQDVPGHLTPVCAMEDQSPLAESDATGIVAAVRTYRAMLSEDAVEAVARVIDPIAWSQIDRATVEGVTHRNFAHWGNSSRAIATAVIECLLARGEGG